MVASVELCCRPVGEPAMRPSEASGGWVGCLRVPRSRVVYSP